MQESITTNNLGQVGRNVMNKKQTYRFTLLLVLSFVLTSCVTVSSRAPKPVPAGYMYKGSYIDIKVPNSNGWHLVSSSPAGMEFARSGGNPGESFAAQVLMFPLVETQSEDEFVALVKDGFKTDTNSERFSTIKSDFQYSTQRNYPCVSVENLVEDKQAQTSPSSKDKLLLQSKSLYCRHPVRQDSGFAIIYSFRGKAIYSSLNAEANDYIDSVQVPDH